MRRTSVVLALSLGACSPPKAPPCSSLSGSTITVRGAATLRTKPDGVSFSVGVETRAASVVEAFKTNVHKVESVVAALKQKGVTSEDMQTSELDASSVTTDSGKVAGFRVSSLVTVRSHDVASAPALLEAAVLAGANQVGSLSFFVADPALSQRKGLELALKDARAKAEALASLSSRTIGDVVCVSDEGASHNDAYERLSSLGYTAKPVLEPGSQAVGFGVSVVFELK